MRRQQTQLNPKPHKKARAQAGYSQRAYVSIYMSIYMGIYGYKEEERTLMTSKQNKKTKTLLHIFFPGAAYMRRDFRPIKIGRTKSSYKKLLSLSPPTI
jgi:hypothetical protein